MLIKSAVCVLFFYGLLVSTGNTKWSCRRKICKVFYLGLTEETQPPVLSFLPSPSFMSSISSLTEQSLRLALASQQRVLCDCFHNGVLPQVFIHKVQTPLPHPTCGSVNLELWIIKRNLPKPPHTHTPTYIHIAKHTLETYTKHHVVLFPTGQEQQFQTYMLHRPCLYNKAIYQCSAMFHRDADGQWLLSPSVPLTHEQTRRRKKKNYTTFSSFSWCPLHLTHWFSSPANTHFTWQSSPAKKKKKKTLSKPNINTGYNMPKNQKTTWTWKWFTDT